MMMAASMVNRSPESLALRAAARAQRLAQLTNDLTWLLPPEPPQRVPRAKFKKGTVQMLASTTPSSVALIGTTTEEANGPQPPGGGGSGGGETNGIPDMGFYQVVKDGVKILDSSVRRLTNGVLADTVKIGFEAGNATQDGTGTNVLGTIENAALIIDGVQFAGDGVIGAPRNSSYPWQISMDTRFLENGDHGLQVQVTWRNPDSSDNNHQFLTRYSNYISITVSNFIYYPQWEPEIGEADISAYFLKTACTNADWEINIYDVSSNFVQKLTGHTTDGNIEAYWNMIDTNGVARTNADLDPEFSSIVVVSDPGSAHTPKKKQRHKDWPDHGMWTICYQDFFKFEYSQNNYMKGSINAFANTAAKYGGYLLQLPNTDTNIGQTYPTRYQKTNHLDPSITQDAVMKDQLLLEAFLSLTNSRNFYYNGHANANVLASGGAVLGGIPTSELASYIKHRYRFVFLDGCNTANGNLDKAFGINGPGVFALTYYQNTGMRPAAFCGYTIETFYETGGPRTVNGITYDDTIPNDVPFFITNFIFYWDLESRRLRNAFDSAQVNLSPVEGWLPGNNLQIYGYDDLKIDEYNQRSDWP